MAIDTRERPINIKNLIVESPKESVRPFNAETEITKEDWEVIDGFIKKFPVVNLTTAGILTNIKLLSPEHFKNYVLVEPEWRSISDIFAHEYVTIFPDASEKLGLDEEYYENEILGAKRRESLLEVIFLSRLVPERLSELATDERHDLYSRRLKEYEEYASQRINDAPAVDLKANFRILFPHINLELTDESWNKMRADLRQRMNYALSQKAKFEDDWSPGEFIAMARDMKILAADEVKVDKDGIHLIFNPKTDLGEETPQLPERKKF